MPINNSNILSPSQKIVSQYTMVAGITGMLSSTIGMASVLYAILLTQNFSWNSPLSDMGNINAPTAPIFNYGLMVSGLLGVFFAIGLLKLPHIVGRIGSSFLVIAAIALFEVGYFPLGANDSFHVMASYHFFIFLTLTLLTMWVNFAITHQRVLCFATLSAGVIALSCGIILILEDNDRIEKTFFPFGLAEFIPSLTLSVWIFFMGFEMAIRRRY